MGEDTKANDLKLFVRSQVDLALELCRNNLSNVKHTRNSFLILKKLVTDFVSGDSSQARIFRMPGLRGVGKTTLLRQTYLYLHDMLKVSKEKILLVDSRRLVEEYNSSLFELFNAYEEEILKSPFESLKENMFILLDEVHYDPKWGEAITVLTERSKKIFFVISGSSALRLTTSDLERRSNLELIFPLNFQEYAMLRYSIFPPVRSNTAQLIRIALFEADTEKAYDILQSVWNKLTTQYFNKLPKGIDPEIKDFLMFGGFPFTLIDFSLPARAVDALTRSLEQMIRCDVYPFMCDIESKDARRYFAILHCLVKSLSNPASNTHIFESVKPLVYSKGKEKKLFSSDSLVHNVIDNLIKTRLIFPVKPLSAEEKVANFAWKYYFATSTVVSSLLMDMGQFNKEDNSTWGKIIENEIAAAFEKNRQLGKLGNLFFDFKDEGADFVVFNNSAEKRVFEATYSTDKTTDQVLNTMIRTKSKFGALVGNYTEVKKINNVLLIPYPLLFMI